MKIHSRILRICLLICVGIAPIAQAEQHICPSPDSIKRTITHHNMKYHTESDEADVDYTGNFDTTETWQLSFSVFNKSTEVQEAKDEGLHWTCFDSFDDHHGHTFDIEAISKSR